VVNPEIEQAWAQRDDMASLTKAIKAFETGLQGDPTNQELLARMAIGYYWKAENMPGKNNREERKLANKKGMEYAAKLIEINPDSLPGHFWYASNEAMYGVEVGIMKSLTVLPDLRKHIDFVLKKEKFYYRGGPQRYLGRLVCNVPGILRKTLAGGTLEDAEQMLKEAIVLEPNFAYSHLVLSEVYGKMNRWDLAKEQLKILLTIPEDALPEYAADNRRDKRRARILLEGLSE
jgi:tetratricopeptide (TPR) repeat protein